MKGVRQYSKRLEFSEVQEGSRSSQGRLLCLLEDSKFACFRDPWKKYTPVAAGLRPGRNRQCLHLSRGGAGGGGRKRKPKQNPKLLSSSGEGAAGEELRAAGKRGAGRVRGEWGGGDSSHFTGGCPGQRGGSRRLRAPSLASPHPPRKRAEPKPGARRPAEPAPSPQPSAPRQTGAPGRGVGLRRVGWVPLPSSPKRGWGSRRWRSPGSSGAAAMGMAQGPGEELAPRGRTGCSDAELVRAEGKIFAALSAKQRHGRPPGVSALPRDPHPITLRPLPSRPPPPPPPRRPPAHSTHSPIMQRGNRCRLYVTSGRRYPKRKLITNKEEMVIN
ncbi:WAS/WASL-interacting protein family member 1-like [Rousettus aegyptiacus]|uniref:WAS/WASL-interacting protein family member 1-like n=1 Tax=Rousettus aegyptiacus TaxID=9407 RepID=UPI00168CFC35|nr:WAS/WASL-interacting protein family member 1-like [Rousettus aegyptiacus]